jgi:hypothetical protein
MPSEFHALKGIGSFPNWPSIASASAQLSRHRRQRGGAVGNAQVISLVPGGGATARARANALSKGRNPR